LQEVNIEESFLILPFSISTNKLSRYFIFELMDFQFLLKRKWQLKQSMKKKRFENFDVYPNPSTGTYNIKLPVNSKAQFFEVYDVVGNLISYSKLNSSTNEHKLTIDSADGVYFIKVLNSSSEQIGFVKVLKN